MSQVPMIVHATLKDGRNRDIELTTSNWNRFDTNTETNDIFNDILDDYNSKAKYQSNLKKKELWNWTHLKTNNEYDTDFVVKYQMPDSTERKIIPHHKIYQNNPFYDSFENKDKKELRSLNLMELGLPNSQKKHKVIVYITMVLPRDSFSVIRQGEGKKKIY